MYSLSADHPPKAVLPPEFSGLQLPGPTWGMATLRLHRHSRPPPSPGGSGPELTLSSFEFPLVNQVRQAYGYMKSQDPPLSFIFGGKHQLPYI